MIPGSNLLQMALSAIASQAVTYLRFESMTTRADGVDVPTFEAPVTLYGSWQPVPAERLVARGLDPAREHAAFFVSTYLQEPTRDRSADRCEYGGFVWEARDAQNWFVQDGWLEMLFEKVGPVA